MKDQKNKEDFEGLRVSLEAEKKLNKERVKFCLKKEY